MRPQSVVEGRFVVQARVSRSALSTVYRAWDRTDQRQVALKIVEASAGSELDRFLLEARWLAELRHPGVVAFVAWGALDDGRAYLATAWLEGLDLRHRLRRGPLTPGETVVLLQRVASVLALLHQRGLCHGDIKPSNLLLSAGDVAQTVLLDFGLARHTLPEGSLAPATAPAGTPSYLAPEQWTEPGGPGQAADVFALGCVGFECLTGAPPLRGAHGGASSASDAQDLESQLRASWQQPSPELSALIAAMLAEPARQRPTATTLLRRLQPLMQDPSARGDDEGAPVTAGGAGDAASPPPAADDVPRRLRADDMGRSPSLLGKRTSCVGRARDLAWLEGALSAVLDESSVKALLVTGAPGIGKSRLRWEFLSDVERGMRAHVMLGRAEVVGAGTPLALMTDLLRSELRRYGPGSDDVSLQRLVRERFPLERHALADAFLGELLGLPPACPPPQLLAARHDPAVSREWLSLLLGEWLDATSDVGPLLLVLEDLHWGDQATISLLERFALRRAGRPILLLALARPEVHEQFPRLWSALGLEELKLGGLSRAACQQLLWEVLGECLEPSVVERTVALAAGNAFVLEELIRRWAATGQLPGGDGLPEAVLVTAQASLAGLSPEAQRVLRAASVYGEEFTAQAVLESVGADVAVQAWLDALLELEILVRRSSEGAYAFRHELLREAAYASLGAGQRAEAHGRAARTVERMGHARPLVLAQHHEQAGHRGLAAQWLTKAAALALGFHGATEARRLIGRGLELAETNAQRAALLALRCLASATVDRFAEAREDALATLAWVEAGRPEALQVLGLLCFSGVVLDDAATVERAVEEFRRVERPEASAAYGLALSGVVSALALVGQGALAERLLAPSRALCAESLTLDPFFEANVWLAEGYLAAFHTWRFGPAQRWLGDAHARHLEMGYRFGEAMSGPLLGLLAVELGDRAEAERIAERLTATNAATQFQYLGNFVVLLRVRLLVAAGKLAAALEYGTPLMELENQFNARAIQAALASALVSTDAPAAYALAQRAQGGGPGAPALAASPLASLAEASLALGRYAEALSWSQQAVAHCQRGGALPSAALRARLVEVRAHLALGDEAGAAAALGAALVTLQRIVAHLEGEQVRSFLVQPHVAALRELSGQLGVGAAAAPGR